MPVVNVPEPVTAIPVAVMLITLLPSIENPICPAPGLYIPVLDSDAKLKERMRKKAEQDLGIMAGRAEVKDSKTTPKTPEAPLNFELPSDFSSQLAAEIARRKKETSK